MDYILDGIKKAFELIASFDSEIYGIVGLSLFVSLLAVFISLLIGIPLGMGLGTRNFRGKGIILRIIYTFMSMPPVIAGLFLFLILMRRGPLGRYQLNYTVTAMIIVQICLVTPIIIGLTYNLVRDKAPEILRLGVTLGGSRWSNFLLLLHDLRRGLAAAVVSGFGRAISEVGAVMIVGGNITGKTRVMTTYIAELKSMGDYSRAIAVGIILLLISFIVNTFLYQVQQRGETE
ncbi:MAG: ABC transporter permease [Clostridiales Family XIII bacterium]|jgi:tungstate transport system permease protein|nr:ABC transporter permease [Clostridiales Family XIII bacterium]